MLETSSEKLLRLEENGQKIWNYSEDLRGWRCQGTFKLLSLSLGGCKTVQVEEEHEKRKV